ncbi:tetratricopeptide repeat protein [Pseudobacteriovorax antillogorgiicola]|uniref:Tetratricopeptide repeat-containing protein n=1 Tax=Pseudobacteriovorax antillogorgiicola TaxID=1513793 RepID=A0A1Y6BQH5_9BACT|nr:CDC27 family protein [Pseudobacteriovorax antillogorgiicola]TCS53810.1 hypothetical protein EDD56_107119 [Pseudobacteriovorax antillogorgiicola]SMF22029.1 Tetratricopeptide repeat-containing protein [Pseudobacteriovorax antillogorgiicola]
MARLLFLISLLSMPVLGQTFDQRFRQAQSYYDNQQYRKAGKVLVPLIREFPNRSSALELLALVYFQRGKFSQARDVFDRMNYRELSRDAGYAWGASYYAAKQWKKAVYGFKKVPRKSPYRPLAAYFLGVSYFRMKRWYPAKKFLLRADDDKLLPIMKRNKARMLVAIKKRRNEELRSIISSSGTGVASPGSGPKAMVIQPTPPPQKFVFQDKAAELTEPESRSLSVKADLRLNQLSRTMENHGFVNETLDVIAHRESLELGLMSSFGRDQQSTFGLRAKLGYGEVSFDSTASSFITLEQTTGSFIRTEKTSLSEAYLSGWLEPYLSWSLTPMTHVQISAYIEEHGPQSDDGVVWSNRFADLSFQLNKNALEFTFNLLGGERTDEGLGTQTVETSFGAGLAWEGEPFNIAADAMITNRVGDIYVSSNPYRWLLSDLGLEAMNGYGELQSFGMRLGLNFGDLETQIRARILNRNKPNGIVTRPRQTDFIDTYGTGVDRVEAVLSYPVFEGVSLFGSGGFQAITGYVDDITLEGSETPNYYEADAEQTNSAFGAIAQPFEWLSLNAKLGFHTTVYRPRNFSLNDAFRQENPDFSTYSSFYLNVFYEF